VKLVQYVCIVYSVCMTKIQYTIRNIPPSVDRVIRKRSKQSGTSFNQTVVELLSKATFGTTQPPADTNFDWLYNQQTLDGGFDKVVHDISRVDKPLWQ
jgi:hypothetical protein